MPPFDALACVLRSVTETVSNARRMRYIHVCARAPSFRAYKCLNALIVFNYKSRAARTHFHLTGLRMRVSSHSAIMKITH